MNNKQKGCKCKIRDSKVKLFNIESVAVNKNSVFKTTINNQCCANKEGTSADKRFNIQLKISKEK